MTQVGAMRESPAPGAIDKEGFYETISTRHRPPGRSGGPLLLTGGHALAASARQPRSALTADEAIACIRTAVTAQAGLVKEVEGDDEKGKHLCEVKIVDETGKRHKLSIDV